MRKNWKKWAAILGGAMLLCSSFEVVPVRAEEEQTQANPQATLQPATNVHWSDRGQMVFTNPNTEACVVIIEVAAFGKTDSMDLYPPLAGGDTLPFDYYHWMEGNPGDYTFKVTLRANDIDSDTVSGGTFTYTVPDKKLPAPIVSVTRDGIITFSLPETDAGAYKLGDDYCFEYMLLCNGTQIGPPAGCDQNTLNISAQMDPDKLYTIYVRTLSRNINKYRSSDWLAPIPINPSEQQSDSVQPKPWVPTPEELKLFEACGAEEVVYTENADNAYNVTIKNSVQGFLCWDSFNAVRGNYTIARTYNIYPTDSGMIYKMDGKAKITMTIPESLRAEGRSFQMIVVTEDGRPAVLKDLDSDPNTITFETDCYYAFALTYRDKAVSKR